MRWTPALAGWLLCCSVASAAQADPVLARIRAKVVESLSRLPNFTCAETIERFERQPQSRIFAPLDTLRLDVAWMEGHEWEMAGQEKAIGNGGFVLLAKDVFQSSSTLFTPAPGSTLNGAATIRYDYRVAPESSSYTLRANGKQATVGHHGSFWARERSLDLMRLEVHADGIPKELGLVESSHALVYQPVRIGDGDFMLADNSELALIDSAGYEKRNVIRLSACRRSGSEAAIRRPEPAAKAAPTPVVATVAGPDSEALKAARKELPHEIVLLARIKAKAAENLTGLPNYTCTETIERTRRQPRSKKFEPLDTLRLEVALVDGKELFAWPGAGKFEEKGIGELVGPGAAIGNGNFALHAKSIFLSGAPTFTYAGETTLDGRDAIRYDYRVPQMLSRYLIRIRSKQAMVGYHGSLWVEADTLDLMRLEVHADSISMVLDLSEASDTLEYRRARIGAADFLLPQSSELVLTDLMGVENRNRTTFSGCRQYAGESVLTFGDEPVVDTAPQPQIQSIVLPAGLSMEMQLQTPIHSGRSATGDPVQATLSRDVKMDGKVLAPKGAVVTGRITRLERQEDHYVVGLEFSTIKFDHSRGTFRAKLHDPGLAQPGRGRQGSRPRMEYELGVFSVPGSSVSLRKGHTMVWRTQP